MPKTIFNNSPRKKVMRIKIDGKVFREDIPAFSSRTLELMDDFSSVVSKVDRVDLQNMETGELSRDIPSGRSKIDSNGIKVFDVYFNKTVAAPNDLIREGLTGPNQVLYDILEVGYFMRVSKSEYDGIALATNASKYGLDDGKMGQTSTGNMAANTVASLSDDINKLGSIPKDRFIIGFYIDVDSSVVNKAYSIELRTSKSYKGTDFALLGNILTGNDIAAVNRKVYFLRKSPAHPTVQKTYVAIKYSKELSSIDNPGVKTAYTLDNEFNTAWSDFTSATPKVQYLAAAVKNW